jgi:hypothetical protein
MRIADFVNPAIRSAIRNPQSAIDSWVGWESNQVTTGREPNAFRQEEGGPKLKNGRSLARASYSGKRQTATQFVVVACPND